MKTETEHYTELWTSVGIAHNKLFLDLAFGLWTKRTSLDLW